MVGVGWVVLCNTPIFASSFTIHQCDILENDFTCDLTCFEVGSHMDSLPLKMSETLNNFLEKVIPKLTLPTGPSDSLHHLEC